MKLKIAPSQAFIDEVMRLEREMPGFMFGFGVGVEAGRGTPIDVLKERLPIVYQISSEAAQNVGGKA